MLSSIGDVSGDVSGEEGDVSGEEGDRVPVGSGAEGDGVGVGGGRVPGARGEELQLLLVGRLVGGARSLENGVRDKRDVFPRTAVVRRTTDASRKTVGVSGTTLD